MEDYLSCRCGRRINPGIDTLGPECGVYSCKKGHIFCIDCSNKKRHNDINSCYPEGYDHNIDWVITDLCPICDTTKDY